MSFLSSRGNSPPVKDPGLGIRSLKKLKNQLEKEMEVLDQLEASLDDPDQAAGTELGGGDVRRKLFNAVVYQGGAAFMGVIIQMLHQVVHRSNIPVQNGGVLPCLLVVRNISPVFWLHKHTELKAL